MKGFGYSKKSWAKQTLLEAAEHLISILLLNHCSRNTVVPTQSQLYRSIGSNGFPQKKLTKRRLQDCLQRCQQPTLKKRPAIPTSACELLPFLSLEGSSKMAVQTCKKRKPVADGSSKLSRMSFSLGGGGWRWLLCSQLTPARTEIIILATRTQNVLGEKGSQIRELTAAVQKRFSFPAGSAEL